jgi:hypothetical protein
MADSSEKAKPFEDDLTEDDLKHRGKTKGEMNAGDTHGSGGTAGITGDQRAAPRGGGSGAGGSGGQGGGSQGGGGQGSLKG